MTMFGVYWEYSYSYDDTIASFLFIPEYAKKGAPGGSAIAPTIMYRTVSTQTPQKTYRFHHGKPSNAGLIGTWGDPSTLAVQMMPQLSIFSDPVIQSVDGNPDFDLKQSPIFLEISEQELANIAEDVTPRSLTARLYRARTAAGYPALPGKDNS